MRALDTFVSQLVVSGGQLPDLDAETRIAMARAQVKFALGCLSGEPDREMALVALLDAVDHLRAVRSEP